MTTISVIDSGSRDLALTYPTDRSPKSYDDAVKALHQADKQLALVRQDFQCARELAAKALAPFDGGTFVRANAGPYEGRSFRAETFSIGYEDESCEVPVLVVTGPLDSGRAEREVRRGEWAQAHPGLFPWAKSENPGRLQPSVDVPPGARDEVREYLRTLDAVKTATERSRQCHRDLLMTQEVVDYVRPVKPGEEGDELSPGGWRDFFKLRVKLERVQLKSTRTRKPWNPADLSWIAQGRLLSSGGRDLGVRLEWVGNVSTLRAGSGRQPWQRVRETVRVSTSAGFVAM